MIKYEYTFLYVVCVQFLGEIDIHKVSYLHNIHIWIWIIAVNHLKMSKFNKAFKFSTISWYFTHKIHNNNAFVSIPLSWFSYHILHSRFWELCSVYCIIWSKGCLTHEKLLQFLLISVLSRLIQRTLLISFGLAPPISRSFMHTLISPFVCRSIFS